MKEKVIEYKSHEKVVSSATNVLDTIDEDGIVGSWLGCNVRNRHNYTLNLTWNFDWTRLKSEGIECLTGHIIVKPSSSHPQSFAVQRIGINWKEAKRTVNRCVQTPHTAVCALFEYHLTAHYAEISEINKMSYDEMFAAMELNDMILVVEGKQLHVNKSFLSYHSEFFRALFSSNFKEGNLTEIPIEDVSFEDFGLLMSAIYPNAVFPNGKDNTAEKLLELADRFLMPSVTNIVEHHLLHISKLSIEKVIWLADAYELPTLLDKCIRSIDTVQQARSIERSPEYETLSLQTNQMLFRRLLQLV